MKYVLALLGLTCSHAHYSFPRTVFGITYVCCLRCGTELHYDWKEMRCGGEKDAQGRRVNELLRLGDQRSTDARNMQEAKTRRKAS
jgi:hypothetical protein